MGIATESEVKSSSNSSSSKSWCCLTSAAKTGSFLSFFLGSSLLSGMPSPDAPPLPSPLNTGSFLSGLPAPSALGAALLAPSLDGAFFFAESANCGSFLGVAFFSAVSGAPVTPPAFPFLISSAIINPFRRGRVKLRFSNLY